MKNLSLIFLLFISLPGFALNGPCTPGSAGTGFSGTTTYCVGAVATALNYNYAECSVGAGGATGVSCTATWYYNTTNTTNISGATVTVSGPTAFTSVAGANGNLPAVTPITTTAGTYYYFCVVSWVAPGTCAPSFVTGTQAITINPNPVAITGAAPVCVGATITLNDATTGGTWTSSNTGQATIGSTTGIVTGVGGTASPVMTYMLPTGCKTTTTVTVNTLPSAILGTTTACAGLTTSLSDGVAGGTWSSSNTSVATIGTNHIVTGVSAGTSTISYILATGCYKTTTVNINQTPASITGTAAACIGGTTTLSNTVAGGVWSSSNTAQATVGSATGIVTYVAAGNPVIAYTMATGCKNTLTITVNALPAAITGTLSVCAGLTTTLADGTAGGTWSSSNTAVGTIGTAHIVAGISGGTTTISYTLATGCYKTTNVTVNAVPAAITGANGVCKTQTTTLGETSTGGVWSSSLTTVATISTAGVVTGVAAAGTTTIAYTFGTGCKITKIISINPAPAAISGSLKACVGYTTTLTDATAGGTWTSANTAIAAIGSSSGIVSGIATGSATISYIAPNGCYTTNSETINPIPANITGTKTACPGATTALTDATGGSLSWTSSNVAVATAVNSGTITGVASGTSTITYTITSGCFATATVTVIATPAAVNGANVVCSNAATTLTDASSGTLWTSTWSSSNVSVATVGSATGVVSGVSTGTATIIFSTGCGANTSKTITVNPTPAVITGTNTVCTGLTTNLTDATSGGTWASGNTSVATVSTSATVTGVAGGTAIVSYTAANGCFVINTVTVNSNPATVTVTGGGAFCNNTTLNASNGGSGTIYYEGLTSNGTSLTTPAASQTISASGTYYFRALSTEGCWSAQGSATVSINPLSAISNNTAICPGNTQTLTDASTGGTWSSSNPSVASIGSANGIVSAIATGTATITYSIVATGCKVTAVTTVNGLPTVSTGTLSPVLKGNTSTPLHFYTTGAPSTYNLAWCGSAHTAGFSDVTAGRLDTLAQDTILHIAIPSNVTSAMYTATLSVTSSGCASRGTLIRAIITDSLNIYTFAGTGVNGYSGNDGAATAAKLSHPSSVASDCIGNTYIADYDNAVVRKVDARGVVTTFAGNGTIGYSGDGGPATAASLSNPAGLAIDGDGNVYISDYNNMVIRKVDPSGIITTFAGNGGHGYSGDGGPATSAQLQYPVGLAVDNANNVYIADNLNSVIRMVNTSGKIYTVAGNGTVGYNGDGSQAVNASLSNPRGVAVDGAGNMYITDYGNNVIRKVSASGTISTFAGIGIAGYGGDGSNATFAQLNTPWGIAVDNYGDVYFSELQNNVIRKIDTNGIIITIAGNYNLGRGFSGNGGLAINAALDQPMGIAINCSGNLYIADNANYAVRILGQYNRTPFFVGGATQSLNAYQNNPVTALNSILAVTDFDTVQTETWTIASEPSNGTLSVSYTTSSTGSTLTPSGLTYTPAPGYTGTDVFVIQVSDGKSTTTTTVNVTVSNTGGRMSNPTAGVNNTTGNNTSMQVFPNPSNGTFNLKTSGAGTFYLFSIEGKYAGEYAITDMETVINVPGALASGIYVGRFKNTDGNTTDVKLVIER